MTSNQAKDRTELGALFVKGITAEEIGQFLKDHDAIEIVSALYGDTRKADSVWIDGVYFEYRPNVGGFDGVTLIE